MLRLLYWIHHAKVPTHVCFKDLDRIVTTLTLLDIALRIPEIVKHAHPVMWIGAAAVGYFFWSD